jgi:hypothetical protein
LVAAVVVGGSEAAVARVWANNTVVKCIASGGVMMWFASSLKFLLGTKRASLSNYAMV